MNFLIVHQNFPGQYFGLCMALRENPANKVVFLTQQNQNQLRGIGKVEYGPRTRVGDSKAHPWAQHYDNAVQNGLAVRGAAMDLRQRGFRPDVMIGHNGWGETMFLKDVWPDVPLIGYFEWYEKPDSVLHGFEPEFGRWIDGPSHGRATNAIHWVALEACDAGHVPTWWQYEQHPAPFRAKLHVVHEGVDVLKWVPKPGVRFRLPDGRELTAADEVLTYCSRKLEPARGFHTFMRALPEVQRRRPKVQAVLVGDTGLGYSRGAPDAENYLELMRAELGDRLDWSRIHVTGTIPIDDLTSLFQISTAHVYLTVPFVLSWSMLQAMSCGVALVASATEPVLEVVRDGENGRLVPFADPAAVAEGLVATLAAPDRNVLMRDAARRTILERYDLQRVCLPQFLRLIQDQAARAAKRM